MNEISSQDIINKIESFNKPEGKGFNEEELKIIDEMLERVTTEEEKTKVFNYIKKNITGDAKKSLDSIIQEKENPFSYLQEKVGSKNEIMKKFFNVSDKYFDYKLNEIESSQTISFSSTERENIKLVLWNKLIQNLNIDIALGTITSTIEGKIKELFNFSKGEQDENNIEKIIEGLTKIENELNGDNEESKELFSEVDILMGDAFTKIETAKKGNKNLNSVESVSLIINGKEKSFEDIKNLSLEKLKSIEKMQGKSDLIVELIASLPKDWQKEISSFLKDIAQKSPILGFLLSLFFGKGFLEGEKAIDTKTQKSVNNLLKLIEETKEENKAIKKLNPEKLTTKSLKSFFKYLDKNKVDYTTETFWSEVLSGKTENDKIKKVHSILSIKGEIIQKSGDNITTDFIKKLNDIENLEVEFEEKEINSKKEELEKLEKKQKKAQEELEKLSPNEKTEEKKQKIKKRKIKIDKTKGEIMIAKQEIKQKQELIDSISSIEKLPHNIDYKGNKVKLNIVDNNIILGENKYKININTIFSDIFKGIRFDNGTFKVKYFGGEKEIPKDKIIETLTALLTKGSYKSDIEGQENATIKIEKIS
ncbi:hypothetical protein CSB08_01180 [Candidatus Gracilibacteria bacterium]|nr:MAG: hypothetical protein CSB08_01180 [Candidatus Gracilibacteria bacterium]PIE85583.1 MAG: hypothetical protein CSA08_01255 [Candidatus Gracilibacteria bacterium]